MARDITKEEQNKLLEAVKKNNTTFIKDFFEKNKDVDINAESFNVGTILHQAVLMSPTKEILTMLVKDYGADPHKQNKHRVTPLHYAASKGGSGVKDLVELGANPNIKDKYGYDPLEYLIATGKSEGVKSYIQSLPEIIPQIQEKQLGHLAAKASSKEILEFLISNEYYDINTRDEQDRTLVHAAVSPIKHPQDSRRDYERSSSNIINYLKEHVSDINAATYNGITPLHIAVSRALYNDKHIESPVKTLIELQAPINSQTKEELYTPLHLAVLNGDYKTTELLLAHNADVNLKDKNGNTALHYATQAKDTKMIDFLISNKADIEIKNKLGSTPLKLAQSEQKQDHKTTNIELQELFKENNLLVRATDVKDEMHYLHSGSITGNYFNVEYGGNRYRSCSLLVPDVKMQFYGKNPNALLYNADKATIRAYILGDGYTNFSQEKDKKLKFHNINKDKHVFQNTLSRQDFAGDYKEYFDEKLRDKPVKNFNEVLANLFPESLVAIASTSNDQMKLKALNAKYYISEKYGYDLPIAIVEDGKVNVWNPTLSEIKELSDKHNERQAYMYKPWLAEVESKIEENLELYKQDPELWKEDLDKSEVEKNALELELSKSLRTEIYGFTTNEKNDCIILNKSEVTIKEVTNFFDKIDSKSTEKNLDKLLELVNKRLKADDLPEVKDLKDFIINKEDIKNLLVEFEKEKASTDKDYKKLNKPELEEMLQGVLSYMQNERPDKSKFLELADYKSAREILEEYQPQMIKEANKVKADLMTKKVEQFFVKSINFDKQPRHVDQLRRKPSTADTGIRR